MHRTQMSYILEDLKKKMVFLVGPRQIGKTWLSTTIATHYKSPLYLNYDRMQDRKLILEDEWPKSTDLLILDEFHKLPDWKRVIKGIYDTKESHLHILVTGSATLDVFHSMGESLAGRFFKHRLLPFSLNESAAAGYDDLERLFVRGGFPEPFLAKSESDIDRWRRDYINGLVREDVFTLENIKNLRDLENTLNLLRDRVGSPISYSSLSRDIGVSPNTIRKFILILEALYIVFRVVPFSKNIARSLLKEPKIYLYDTGLIEKKGPKFENTVAVALLKHAYFEQDVLGKDVGLYYLRTKDQEEVDFCLVEKNKVISLVEAKTSDTAISKTLLKFQKYCDCPAFQVHLDLTRERQIGTLSVQRAETFLRSLSI